MKQNMKLEIERTSIIKKNVIIVPPVACWSAWWSGTCHRQLPVWSARPAADSPTAPCASRWRAYARRALVAAVLFVLAALASGFACHWSAQSNWDISECTRPCMCDSDMSRVHSSRSRCSCAIRSCCSSVWLCMPLMFITKASGHDLCRMHV